MVLDKLSVPRRSTILNNSKPGGSRLGVAMGGLENFLLSICSFFFLILSGRRPDKA